MWLYASFPALIVAYVVYYRVFHPLSRIPGPFLASISGLWLALYAKQYQRQRNDVRLHEKYGPVVRVAPNEIIFSNPDYFKAVYGAGSNFKKGRWYEVAVDPAQRNIDTLNMLPEMNKEKLRMQKRLVGPVYSIANVRNHESLVNSTISLFLAKMAGMTDKPIDFYRWLELLCLDMFTELTYSKRVGALETGTDKGHIEKMDGFGRLICWLGTLPTLSKVMMTVIPKLSALFNQGGDLPVFAYCKAQMKRVRNSSKELSVDPCMFVDLLHVSNSRPEFKPLYADMMSLTNLGAGIDTTTWTLATTLVFALQDSSVRSRLIAEIDTAVGSSGAKKDGPVSYDQAMKLSYLQACMLEAQRLAPSLGMALPRVVPAQGITIDGCVIPPGVTVGMNPYVLSRDKGLFGADADMFNPERWLNATKAQRNDMETRNLTFGGPSRKCPGLHLAWFCMNKVLATLLRDFDVKIENQLDGEPGPGGHKWTEQSYFVTKWSGWEVTLSKR